MKNTIKLGATALAVLVLSISIQSFTFQKKSTSKPVTETFKVGGVCEMCKARIEGAVDVKGVMQAVYSAESWQLKIKYVPEKISKEKIEQLILAKGHDINGKKASDSVYNQLPSCCRYRTVTRH